MSIGKVDEVVDEEIKLNVELAKLDGWKSNAGGWMFEKTEVAQHIPANQTINTHNEIRNLEIFNR